jgi:hypothetical protein
MDHEEDLPEPVEVSEDGLTVTAEFVSDQGLALTRSHIGNALESIAIPLDKGKQKLDRSYVEQRLKMQIPGDVVDRLVALLEEEYPDAFDPRTSD